MFKPQERPAGQLDAAEAGLLGGASPVRGGRRGRVVETKLHREQPRGRSVRARDPTESPGDFVQKLQHSAVEQGRRFSSVGRQTLLAGGGVYTVKMSVCPRLVNDFTKNPSKISFRNSRNGLIGKIKGHKKPRNVCERNSNRKHPYRVGRALTSTVSTEHPTERVPAGQDAGPRTRHWAVGTVPRGPAQQGGWALQEGLGKLSH